MSVEHRCGRGRRLEGRLILLICESCQGPQEDASVSGRVTYSYNLHTEGGGFKFRVGGWRGFSYREHLFPEIFKVDSELDFILNGHSS